MRQLLIIGRLGLSTVGCGLLAGVYFAFSAFIRTSLVRIAPAAGIAAMNAINVEIVRSLFMPARGCAWRCQPRQPERSVSGVA
jgi:uncharacterized membrane protein